MKAPNEWSDRLNFQYHDGEFKDSHSCCTSILTWRDHAWFNARLANGWWRPAYFHNGRVSWHHPPVKSGHKCHQLNLEHKKLVQARVLTQELGTP
jgi:hypothetical protein